MSSVRIAAGPLVRDDVANLRVQSAVRTAASASAKLGARLWGYHGVVSTGVVACVVSYKSHTKL